MMQGKIIELQALRGLAAILVVFYHITAISLFDDTQSSTLLALKSFWAMYGSLGVPLFFVLSGFIITMSIFGGKETRISPKDFLLRRVIRVYPVYWLYLFAMLFLTILQYFFSSKSAVEINFIYFLKSFFLWPTFDKYGQFYPLLWVGWSLVFEMYFYIVFFIALHLSFSYLRTLAFISSVMFIGFVLPYLLVNDVSERTALGYLLCNKLNIFFLSGIVLAGFYSVGFFSRLVIQKVIGIIFIFIMLIMLLRYFYMEPVGDVNFFISLSFSSFFVAYCLIPKKTGVAIYKALAVVGDASYTLYLSHFILIILVTSLWKRGIFLLPENFDLVSALFLLTFLVFISIYLYRFVEKPIIYTLVSAYERNKKSEYSYSSRNFMNKV